MVSHIVIVSAPAGAIAINRLVTKSPLSAKHLLSGLSVDFNLIPLLATADGARDRVTVFVIGESIVQAMRLLLASNNGVDVVLTTTTV
jgi:hypothetical protein